MAQQCAASRDAGATRLSAIDADEDGLADRLRLQARVTVQRKWPHGPKGKTKSSPPQRGY